MQPLSHLLGDHRSVTPRPIINDQSHPLSLPDSFQYDFDRIVDHIQQPAFCMERILLPECFKFEIGNLKFEIEAGPTFLMDGSVPSPCVLPQASLLSVLAAILRRTFPGETDKPFPRS
jgi:hypothetical protein